MNNSLSFDELMMKRCLQLAEQGKYYAPPNPLVGAVLVYNGTIIGEGYHQQFGGPHAEVNCINSVKEQDKHCIAYSTLYVSLEPCAHYGKTPPCTNLIIQYHIPNVVIGCRDSFTEVNGKGIEKLQQAGVKVCIGVLEKECKEINRKFFVLNDEKRPYIILKWAQTVNGIMGNKGKERLMISNDAVNRWVHAWRAECSAILVGTTTVLQDNPQLNNRFASGKSPVRLVIDKHLALPVSWHVLDNSVRTIVFNFLKNEVRGQTEWVQCNITDDLTIQIVEYCLKAGLQSILVEGGARLLNSFIKNNMWDESRVITASHLAVAEGVSAPHLTGCSQFRTHHILNNRVDFFKRLS
ncbi:MAG: bifunctional diaminohydroxyphosphoribosylaminopyrimidine deaminase/5-amino-6-(5-phosphoribosylamino)uracil reductase RibD [Sphingobacteriia bacterium]|nr:bifunctional diaminohydroxyphosphoribosylaminopyrimidine deaminase/5-amino-6-(5-phosphoribosylamino)uracil reductase RibD [Sphingobacteriia bacterium]